MRGGVPWHHGGTAFHAYNNAMLLRMDEMPCENVGLGGRGYAHHSVDIPGYGFVGSRDGIVSSGSKCLCGLGTALPITCLRCSLSLPTPAPLLRLTLMLLDLKTLLLPLPATALRLRLSVPGMHCIRHRGSCAGSGPALEHQNRPHPSGGGDILSRSYAFWIL
jgi:hypothetical protein